MRAHGEVGFFGADWGLGIVSGDGGSHQAPILGEHVMKRAIQQLTVALLIGGCVAAGAYAEESEVASTIRSLQAEQQQLRAEVNGLKAEIQSLRKQLAELQKSQEAGASAAAPSAVPAGAQANTLTQIDKKLDRIAADLAALKRDSAAARPEVRRPATELIGKAAPEFALTSRAGAAVSNKEFANRRATVLNFVAPTCGFCARQLPKIDQVRAEFEPKGVRFVNISEHMGDKVFTPEEAEAKYQSVGSSLELAIDPGNKIGQLFKATSYPTMFVIRPDGVVAQVNIGAKENIDELLRQQLTAMVGN